MFERFTERAGQVVVLAQEESRTFKHNYTGTEHILLGLLREEEGLAARLLGSLDITIERVRAAVRGSSAPVKSPPPVRFSGDLLVLADQPQQDVRCWFRAECGRRRATRTR